MIFAEIFPPKRKNAKVLETSFANRLADPEAQQNGIDKYRCFQK